MFRKNLSYCSFSISPLGIYAGSNNGVAVSADVSFDYGTNIFVLALGSGSEGNFVGKSDDFIEVNLLYGRSLKVSENLFSELLIGAGYFHFNTNRYIDETGKRGAIGESTIGFPIVAKLQFKLGQRYSMGVKIGANVNSVETVGLAGLVLQWTRKRN